jgi:molybdate transport system regulatory protein
LKPPAAAEHAPGMKPSKPRKISKSDKPIQPVKRTKPRPFARLRVLLEPDLVLGPGKADLLESIRKTGSIAAAGRELGMSYTRAWSLVEELNSAFKTPAVEMSRGGSSRGGATLTPLGEQVLAAYRRMEAAAGKAMAEVLEELRPHLRKKPRKG